MLSFTLLEKAIKFSNKTSSDLDVLIAPRIKGTLYPYVSLSRVFKPGEWWVPNFNWTGCSVVSVFDRNGNELQRIVLPRRFSEPKNKQNVICVGLNKTGTTSFSGGLESLGYSLYPESIGHNTLFPDVYHSTLGSTITALENERYNLYQDLPFSLPGFYEKIYQIRPEDIYILTVRDNAEQFVNTCLRFYENQFSYNSIDSFDEKLFYKYNYSSVITIHSDNLYHAMFDLWGIKTFDNLESKLTDVYNKHIDDIVNFFESKHYKNFKIVNVAKSGELENLANWLDK